MGKKTKKVGGLIKPRDKVKSHLWNRSRNSFSQQFKIIRTEIVRHRHASRSTRKTNEEGTKTHKKGRRECESKPTHAFISPESGDLSDPHLLIPIFFVVFESFFLNSNKLSYRILLSLFPSSLKPCECYQSSRLFLFVLTCGQTVCC